MSESIKQLMENPCCNRDHTISHEREPTGGAPYLGLKLG